MIAFIFTIDCTMNVFLIGVLQAFDASPHCQLLKELFIQVRSPTISSILQEMLFTTKQLLASLVYQCGSA